MNLVSFQGMLLVLHLIGALVAVAQADDNLYGDIHHDPDAFRQDFQQHHKQGEKVGDESTDDLFKANKEDDVYYWFSLHDYDHDGFLDGHELRVAWMNSDPKKYTLEVAEDTVDKILDRDDLDNDGKISWEEYLTSQAGK
jgi:hypothetical protein